MSQLYTGVNAVDQGGNSCGKARHWQPVRSRYKLALITSRRSVVRGCPPGLAGGISGSRIAHSRSRETRLGSFFVSSPHLFPRSLSGILFSFSLLPYFTTRHASLPIRSLGPLIDLIPLHRPSQAFAHSLSYVTSFRLMRLNG